MNITRQVVETFVVDGRSFLSEAEAQAYIASQRHIANIRAFAEKHQNGKGPKAVQMVVNILVAYEGWKAAQDTTKYELAA